jgi:hypothetical protein
MPTLLELLAAELEKPRPLPPQVIKHLAGTYGVSRDGVSGFLVHELPKLEDYEVDLVLSPVFTPTLQEQAVVAGHLGSESVPEGRWPELIAALARRPTRAQLLGEDAAAVEVTLREVTLERYVHRLRLQGTIPPALFIRIASLEPAEDRALLQAIARRAVWGAASRMEILSGFLAGAAPAARAGDAAMLLNLVETYEPADTAEVLARLPHWQAVLRQEISLASGPKPFFNERVQEMHGGGRDQRRQEDSRVAAKQRELDFLARLQTLLAR